VNCRTSTAERNVVSPTENQLLQLHKIMELVGETGDIARVEIAQPPAAIGVGVPGTWTRITGFLDRVEAAIVIYERLGGPELPAAARQFARSARQLPTKPAQIVGESASVLHTITNFAENVGTAD
jgi:hypothetical protein